MPTYVPDLRPIQIIWTGPVAWTENQVLGTIGGDFPSLLEHLRDRPVLMPSDPRGNRFMIAHPAGGASVFGNLQASHFHTLPAVNRTWYREAIRQARAVRPFTLGITVDTKQNSPYVGTAPWHRVIYTNPTHVREYWGGSACPWNRFAPGGIYEWWHEGVNANDFGNTIGVLNGIGWHEYFQSQGLHGGCEAVPTLGVGLPDFASLQKMPAWCLAAEFADNPAILGPTVSVAGAHEVHAALSIKQNTAGQFVPDYSPSMIQNLANNGYRVMPDKGHEANYIAAFGAGGQPLP